MLSTQFPSVNADSEGLLTMPQRSVQPVCFSQWSGGLLYFCHHHTVVMKRLIEKLADDSPPQ
jgi:hypothetical protein